ncbi:MAG TPA: hypothetical protein VND19_11640 [Acetobacteraceae bacterium]|nr:hypothetical protein [Acetobacteraceae bacterium]
MPELGLALGLAALYQRVQVTPRSRPRLNWEEGAEGSVPSAT